MERKTNGSEWVGVEAPRHGQAKHSGVMQWISERESGASGAHEQNEEADTRNGEKGKGCEYLPQLGLLQVPGLVWPAVHEHALPLPDWPTLITHVSVCVPLPHVTEQGPACHSVTQLTSGGGFAVVQGKQEKWP